MIRTVCSMKSETLTAFAEHRLAPEEEIQFVDHLLSCERCSSELKEIYASLRRCPFPLLSEEEREKLRQIASKHAARAARHEEQRRVGWRILKNLADAKPLVLAAADGRTADQRLLQAALRADSLVFVALCNKADSGYWRAVFPIPSEPNPEMELAVELTDTQGNAIVEGMFIFCGFERPVKDGWCYLTLADLQKNLKRQSVAFRWASGEEVDGIMELFPEEDDL